MRCLCQSVYLLRWTIFTLFICRALAMCDAPCQPIWLPDRLSLMSVWYVDCVKVCIAQACVYFIFFRALAMCCAPCEPISLCQRCSVVSVYSLMHIRRCILKRHALTWFICNALAMWCAPCESMWLNWRLSVVSVWYHLCEKSLGWRVNLLCSSAEPWQRLVFLYHRFRCCKGPL